MSDNRNSKMTFLNIFHKNRSKTRFKPVEPIMHFKNSKNIGNFLFSALTDSFFELK